MRVARPLHRSLLFAFVALVALASAAAWANSRARHHAMASYPRATSPASAQAVATPIAAPAAVAQVPQASSSAKSNPTESGMRAYLDPETGTIGAPGVSQSAIAGTQSTGPALQEVVLPDGSVMVDLQGTLQDYMILNIDAKGHKVMRCVPNPTEALKSTPTPAEPAKE
jgi:hypothetical protein